MLHPSSVAFCIVLRALFCLSPLKLATLTPRGGRGWGWGWGVGESLTVNQAFSVRPSKKLTSLQMSRSSRMNVSNRVKLSLSHKKLKY